MPDLPSEVTATTDETAEADRLRRRLPSSVGALFQGLMLFSATCLLIASAGCGSGSAARVTPLAPIYYPPPPSPPRVVFLTDLGGDPLFAPRASAMERFLFNDDGPSGRMIGKAFGLAAAGSRLFVCDTQRNVVHVFDFEAQTHSLIGASGSAGVQKPVDAAIGNDGTVYVADPGGGRVVAFHADLTFARVFRRESAEAYKPVAVACAGEALFVLDAAAARVEQWSRRTGDLPAEVSIVRKEAPNPVWPAGLDLNDHDDLFVVDALNRRVDVLSAAGTYLRSIGGPGRTAGRFSKPRHLAVGPDGTVFVVDAGFQRVQMFDGSGRVLMLFGGPGRPAGSDGGFNAVADAGTLTLPAGICVSESLTPFFARYAPDAFHVDYLVFVSDQVSPEPIKVYGFGRPRTDSTSTPAD